MTSLLQVIVVSEYLNFRHAANALGVSQSSVSTRIKALEEALGILIFERRHRGVRLTEAGRRFVAEVLVGIEHLDHAVRTAGAISTGIMGRLAIGLHSSVASGFLFDLRHKYRSQHPMIEQTVTEGRSSKTISLVREGKLDVAFVMGAVDAPDCHCRQFWSETLMLALAQQHRLAMAEHIHWPELAAETFLVRHDGAGAQCQDHIVRRLAEHGKAPHIRRCDVGRDTIMHMVAAGEGITLISESATYVPFPGVAFRPIADETDRARFSAVWSPHNRSPALKNLLDLATEMSRPAARPPETRIS